MSNEALQGLNAEREFTKRQRPFRPDVTRAEEFQFFGRGIFRAVENS